MIVVAVTKSDARDAKGIEWGIGVGNWGDMIPIPLGK
jgi:hypothetical protein